MPIRRLDWRRRARTSAVEERCENVGLAAVEAGFCTLARVPACANTGSLSSYRSAACTPADAWVGGMRGRLKEASWREAWLVKHARAGRHDVPWAPRPRRSPGDETARRVHSSQQLRIGAPCKCTWRRIELRAQCTWTRRELKGSRCVHATEPSTPVSSLLIARSRSIWLRNA